MKTTIINVLLTLLIFLIFTDKSYCQWSQISFPTTEDLYMVRFVSETTGWVVGQNYVYKTTNGGTSWESQDSVLGGGCEALYANDPLTAIYADYSGSGIRLTTDEGTNWYTADNKNYYYYDFKFVNKLLGFAACGSPSSSDSGIVRRTIDGGRTWNTISSVYLANKGYDFEGISFIDSLKGWAVSYKGWVYKTTDGGFNWAFQDSVVLLASPYYVPCRDIQFTSSDSGWVVGGIAATTLIAKTIDGGQSWETEILDSFTTCSIKEIEMVNSHLGWFAGANNGGTMLGKTTNGGQTWMSQVDQSTSPYGFESISMVNESIGYSVGRNGQLYKTINGGGITDVEDISLRIPADFSLMQNYPNPFNPSTTIKYSVPKTSNVSIKIFDVLGNEIETLLSEEKPAGTYELTWNAANQPSGVYFYRLQAGSFVETKKMILLR